MKKLLKNLHTRDVAFLVPSDLNNEFELYYADEQIGKMKWMHQKRSLAIAKSSTGHWAFRYVSHPFPSVLISDVDDNKTYGRVDFSWNNKGIFAMENGKKFFWSPANSWETQFVWSDEQQRKLISFNHYGNLMNREGLNQLGQTALKMKEIDILMLLGWYMLIQDTKNKNIEENEMVF